MPKKREENPTTDYEISIIKRFLEDNENQDVISFKIGIYRFFKNNNKALNNGRIANIKDSITPLGLRATKISKSDDDTISKFNNIINTGDLKTRLNPLLNEHKLIIKARESMIVAISSFNSPMFNFGVESFLVLSHIAWTALLQSIAQDNNINIVDPNKSDKEYLSLSQLICQIDNIYAGPKKILSQAIIDNIKILTELRDAITHSPNLDIPNHIASYLQANCFNFNKLLVVHYGEHRGLDNVFSISLQMATFQPLLQLKGLLGTGSKNSFVHIQNILDNFESNLDSSILENQEYKCSIAILPMSINNANKADHIHVHIIDPDSEEAKEVQNIIFKSQTTIDKIKKYPHGFVGVIKLLQGEGYKINRNTLITINREYNIKNNDKYCYQNQVSKNYICFKYSEIYLDFVRKNLKKYKTRL